MTVFTVLCQYQFVIARPRCERYGAALLDGFANLSYFATLNNNNK